MRNPADLPEVCLSVSRPTRARIPPCCSTSRAPTWEPCSGAMLLTPFGAWDLWGAQWLPRSLVSGDLKLADGQGHWGFDAINCCLGDS